MDKSMVSRKIIDTRKLTIDSIEAAKKLFFAYDGSTFYMSRDGAEMQYLQYGVSKSMEAQWMEELTQQKLSALNRKGNWRTVHFLNHHGNYEYIDKLLDACPKGKLWEKCAYLEELLKYLRSWQNSHIEKVSDLRQALNLVIEKSKQLINTARSGESMNRIQSVIDDAQTMLKKSNSCAC